MPRRRSKSKKRIGRPSDLHKYKSRRGCSRQTSIKYTKRSSPPYPANLCREKKMKGNDGRYYKSMRSKRQGQAYYKWIKV